MAYARGIYFSSFPFVSFHLRLNISVVILWRKRLLANRMLDIIPNSDILQSHHRPREGPFELNDVFAIINAVPAIALLSYGFFNKGLVPGLCFGAVRLLSLSFYLVF